MLIGERADLVLLAAIAAFAMLGWLCAWRSRGQAIDSDRLAQHADERTRICEAKASAIRLSETAARNAISSAHEQATVAHARASSLQFQLSAAQADLAVLRARIAELEPKGEDLYDSTTMRLRNPAALAQRRRA